MNKSILSILLLVFLFSACMNDPLPRHAVPRSKFISILVDVHIAEGMNLDRGRLKIDSIESSSLYLSILEKYGITDEQMLQTSLYYSRHQREYKKIFTEVLDRLSILIEEENAKQEMVIKTDSLAPVKVKALKN